MQDDLGRWLEQIGPGEYASLFAEHAIDPEVLPGLTDANLKETGVPLGHRKKRLNQARRGKAVDNSGPYSTLTLKGVATLVSRSKAERSVKLTCLP